MFKAHLKSYRRVAAIGAMICVPFGAAYAHHSFSPYDLENSVEIQGELTQLQFRNPHITLELKQDDGTVWHIESMNPRRWDNADVPRDLAKVGDEVTIVGWPLKDGSPGMVLSAVTSPDKGRTVVLNRVRQGEGQNRSGSRGSGGMGR